MSLIREGLRLPKVAALQQPTCGAWCTAVAVLLVGCTAAEQRPPGQGSRPLAALCADIQNSYECAQVIERHQLQQPRIARRVAREKTELRLQLEDGKTVTVVDSQPADDVSTVRYSFRDHLNEIGYFLLHRQYYEGEEYVMLHDRMGRMVALPGVPVISPDKSRLVTTFPGLSGGYNPNTVQIWILAPSGLVEEFVIHPRDWEPTDATWVDNGTIRLQTRTGTPGGAEFRAQTRDLKLRDGRWTLQR